MVNVNMSGHFKTESSRLHVTHMIRHLVLKTLKSFLAFSPNYLHQVIKVKSVSYLYTVGRVASCFILPGNRPVTAAVVARH